MQPDVELAADAEPRTTFLSLGCNRRERLTSIAVAGVSIVWPYVAHQLWFHPATWFGSLLLYVLLTWITGLRFTNAGLIGGVVLHSVWPFDAFRLGGELIRLGTFVGGGVVIGVVLDALRPPRITRADAPSTG